MTKKILFQGDSITDGNRGRDEDPNHIHGHGYAYLIASQLGAEHASSQPHFINKGISGNRVSDLYARWNEDAFSLKPDLISILIGVNDAMSIINGQPGGATDRFERIYRLLLDETREVLPEAGIVLCEPFVLETSSTAKEWSRWRSQMDEYRVIVRQLSEEYDTLFVPLQELYNESATRLTAEYWLWDGVHPTTAGHYLLAQQWLKVVQNSKYAIG